MGEAISAQDKQRLEDTAACLIDNPLSLKKPSWGRLIAIYQVDPLVCSALDPQDSRPPGLSTPPPPQPLPAPELIHVAEHVQG